MFERWLTEVVTRRAGARGRRAAIGNGSCRILRMREASNGGNRRSRRGFAVCHSVRTAQLPYTSNLIPSAPSSPTTASSSPIQQTQHSPGTSKPHILAENPPSLTHFSSSSLLLRAQTLIERRKREEGGFLFSSFLPVVPSLSAFSSFLLCRPSCSVRSPHPDDQSISYLVRPSCNPAWLRIVEVVEVVEVVEGSRGGQEGGRGSRGSL